MNETDLINTGDYCVVCGDAIYRCRSCGATGCTDCDAKKLAGCEAFARNAPEPLDDD